MIPPFVAILAVLSVFTAALAQPDTAEAMVPMRKPASMTQEHYEPGLDVTIETRQLLKSAFGRLPAWLKRTRASFEWRSEAGKRRWSTLTVQPLPGVVSQERLAFIQARIDDRGERRTLNAGLGFRHELPPPHWRLGLNMFLDSALKRNYDRISIGSEFTTPALSVYSNLYIGLATRAQPAGRPAHEFEFALRGDVPFVPWLSLKTNYRLIERAQLSPLRMIDWRAEMRLSEGWSFATGYTQKGEMEKIDARLSYELEPVSAGPSLRDMLFSRRPFLAYPSKPSRLAPVERRNEIDRLILDL